MHRKIFQILLVAAGSLLTLISIFTLLMANLNIGILFTFLVGGVLLIYGLFFPKINRATSRGVGKWIRWAACLGFLCLLALTVFIAIYGQTDTADYHEDAVIVLGAGIHGETVSSPLAYRLDRAFAYWRQNPSAVIVVTGGQGFQEHISEAEAMARYLLQAGVPREKILKEEQATSTYENFQYSKAILDDYFQKPYRAVFITNKFHIYRAGQIAKNAGLDAAHVHAGLLWYTAPPNYLRECAAVAKFWVFGN